jgi:hypothetical protein
MLRIEINPMIDKFLLVRRWSPAELKKMAARNRSRKRCKPVRCSNNDKGNRHQLGQERSNVISTVPATNHARGIFAIVVIRQQLNLFVGKQSNARQQQRERLKQIYFRAVDQSNVFIISYGRRCYNITFLEGTYNANIEFDWNDGHQ